MTGKIGLQNIRDETDDPGVFHLGPGLWSCPHVCLLGWSPYLADSQGLRTYTSLILQIWKLRTKTMWSSQASGLVREGPDRVITRPPPTLPSHISREEKSHRNLTESYGMLHKPPYTWFLTLQQSFYPYFSFLRLLAKACDSWDCTVFLSVFSFCLVQCLEPGNN